MRREFVEFNNIPLLISYKNIKEYPIHWHTPMEIVYVIKGEIDITIETETHRIDEGQIEIINSDEAHSIYSEDYNNKVLIISIDTGFLNKYYNIENVFFYTESSGRDAQKADKYEKLREYLSILLCEISQKKEDFEDRVEDTLVELLYHLINNFHYLIYEEDGLKENEEQFERYDRIIKYIYSNYNNKISLQDIARREYLSSHYLSYGIKNTVGYSFNDFLNLTRVEESIKLLLDTDKTISEISEELGFSHTRYFNKHFKKHYNCTPMQYRKKYRMSRKKYEEAKKYYNYPIQEALMELSSYLQDYAGYNFENKIIKLDIDVNHTSNGLFNKSWMDNIYIGSYKNLLLNRKAEAIADVKKEFDSKYALIIGIFSKYKNLKSAEYNKLFFFEEAREGLKILIDLGLKPNIIIEDFEACTTKLIGDFIEYMCYHFGDSEVKKWRFSTSSNMDRRDEEQINSIINNKLDEPIKEEMYAHRNICLLYDTPYMIPYVIHNSINNDDNINTIALFDEINSITSNNNVFFGGSGIINSYGIKKPAYYAYSFLLRLGKNIIEKGEGYIITKEGDDYQILLYSYGEELNRKIDSEASIEKSAVNGMTKRKFSINLAGLQSDYRIISYVINEKVGSSFGYWTSMGRPKALNYGEEELLKEISKPFIHIYHGKKSPIFNIVSTLEGYGANLIMLQKVQKHL